MEMPKRLYMYAAVLIPVFLVNLTRDRRGAGVKPLAPWARWL
jgi:hypothetical protein